MPETPERPPGRGIDYERLYEFRHRRVYRDARVAVWNEIAPYVYELMGRPQRVLDPAAGWGEFINGSRRRNGGWSTRSSSPSTTAIRW